MFNILKLVPLEERIVLDAASIAAVAAAAANTAINAAENPIITNPVIFVDAASTYSGPGIGTSWLTAYSNLSQALSEAASRPGMDQIWMAKGNYIPDTRTIATTSQSATFILNSDVAIYGGFSGDGSETLVTQANPLLYKTVLNGDLGGNDIANDFTSPTYDFTQKLDNAWHVMRVTVLSNVLISGLTIENGFAGATGLGATIFDVRGGGILNVFAPNTQSLTLDHVVLQDNIAMLKTGIQAVTFPGNQPQVRGAAVYNVNNAAFNLSDSLVQNNYTFSDKSFSASAINLEGANIAANVLNTVFLNNTADRGGTFVAGFAGMNVSTKSLYVGDSQFISNTAIGHRGAALGLFPRLATSVFVVENSGFLDNHSDGFGGAVYADSSASGAAVLSGTIVLYKDMFIANSSNSTGGAFASIWQTELLIDQSHFIGNTAHAGGALDLEGSTFNKVFTPPTSSPTSVSTITNSTFIDNVATGEPINPALIGFPAGSVFSNSALYGGGAITLQVGQVTNVIDSRFVNNTAPNGGAISVVGNSAIIRVGTANIPLSAGATLNVSGSDFVNNQATLVDFPTPGQVTGDGGAIISKGWLYDGLPIYGATITNITSSTFTNNRADHAGGAIAGENTTLSLLNSAVKNSDSGKGGAVYLLTSSATITGNTFFKSNDAELGDQFYLDSSIVNGYNSDTPTDVAGLINSLKSQIQKYDSGDIYIV